MDADILAPVIAALGASFLTILGSFGLFQWQRWRDNRANTRANKEATYRELHARTYSFVRRAGTLGLAKQFRSGITEGVSVSLGQRKPLDVFQLHEWLEADFRPITDAYSKVCLFGSQEAIDIANNILAACGALVGIATETDPHQGILVRLMKGERPTPEQAQAFKAAQKVVFIELEALVNIARREIGAALVALPLERAELETKKQLTSSPADRNSPPRTAPRDDPTVT